MAFERMDPPGTFCHRAALLDFIRPLNIERFVEVGVGAGGISKLLLQRGLRGIGVERSKPAVALARTVLEKEIVSGRYELIHSDFIDLEPSLHPKADLALALMVMEHVADEVGFLRAMMSHLQPGGYLLISVPGRRDRWSFEDETVGHMRRYERSDLETVLRRAGACDIAIRSVSVPVANLLHGVGNLLLQRAGEARKLGAPKSEQTDTSGIRDIPYKTVFPRWFRLLLNPVALYPLFVVQRLFYSSNLGLELMALARSPTVDQVAPDKNRA
jgi:SAM-dependent methyltransferase